ncbi:MAG: PfkB family carbohydrate kinase [Nitrolancea sp.]
MDELLDLLPVLDRIRDQRVLVIGDLYLDAYIFGRPARVSREAPIMVLEETRREDRLGGGTAPALALRELGTSVSQTGVIGDDAEGRRVVELLQSQQVDTSGILVDDSRPTTTKTRLVAEGPFNVFPQQVARSDRQLRDPIDDDTTAKLVSFVRRVGPTMDAILLSDYRSGVVVPEVVEAVRDVARLSTVDSQGALSSFTGLDLVKCNQAEAETYLGASLGTEEERRSALTTLRQRLGCDRLVVTLGPEGAALAIDGEYREVRSVVRRQVFDVTGAGDTVIAVMTGALAAGADALQALRLSQVAAGIVIGKWGNAQASADEISIAIREG